VTREAVVAVQDVSGEDASGAVALCGRRAQSTSPPPAALKAVRVRS